MLVSTVVVTFVVLTAAARSRLTGERRSWATESVSIRSSSISAVMRSSVRFNGTASRAIRFFYARACHAVLPATKNMPGKPVHCALCTVH